MNEQLEREQIVQAIVSRYRNDSRVHAFWLEGADGLGQVDAYSDLDLVLDVEDGFEETLLSDLEQTFLGLGELGLRSEPNQPVPGLLYRVFHLKNTPETLLLDVTIQSHSRRHVFLTDHPYEQPKVLFDKSGVIQFGESDAAALQASIEARLAVLEGTFAQRIRAVKYAKRGLFLETHAYYHKFVLTPLVGLLRIRYTPIVSDYYLVHISSHLPEAVVRELEELYRISSTSDILIHIEKARVWFVSIRNDMSSLDFKKASG